MLLKEPSILFCWAWGKSLKGSGVVRGLHQSLQAEFGPLCSVLRSHVMLFP